MKLNKYELITEIAMLCDELEAYKRSAESIKRDIEALANAGSDDGLNANDLMCLKRGRREVFEECVYSWRTTVVASRNDDGTIAFSCDFKSFCKNIYSRCPETMSKKEFFEYFDGEFRDCYEEQKEKAIERLEESEASEDE